MRDWSDRIHAILQALTAAANRPDNDARFLARADIRLDRALFPLLARIDLLTPIGTVDLAEAVGRDHSSVSRQVARLEKLGLVARRPSETDGRVRLLRPTAKGADMLSEIRAARRAMIAEHFRGWSREDRETLLGLLERAFGDFLPRKPDGGATERQGHQGADDRIRDE